MTSHAHCSEQGAFMVRLRHGPHLRHSERPYHLSQYSTVCHAVNIEGAGLQHYQSPVDLANLRRMIALLFTKKYLARQAEIFELMVI